MSDETVAPEVDPNMPNGMDPALWATLNAPAEQSEDVPEHYIRVEQPDGEQTVQAVASDDPDVVDELNTIDFDDDGNPLDQQPS